MITSGCYEQLRPNLIDSCVAKLRADVTVVVETRRLQHLIQTAYNLAMRDSGKVSWPTAQVCTWDQWLCDLWLSLVDQRWELQRTLLTRQQSQHIWESVIRTDVAKRDEYEFLLWHITATANQAQSSYALMRAYQIEISHFNAPLSVDAAHFCDWLSQYQQALAQHNWTDRESLPLLICEYAEHICALQTGAVVFAGFDTWPPQSEQLTQSLIDQGMTLEFISDRTESTAAAERHQYQFESVDDEIQACAQWARAVIEANPKTHRVGIVACDLRRIQQRIYRAFSNCLNPDAILDTRESLNLSFHMTLGTELSREPLVIDALNLVELIRGEVPVAVMCDVLRSDRILGWDEEFDQRSVLAVEVLGIGSSVVTLDNVLALIRQRDIQCPQLAAVIRSGQKTLQNLPAQASYAHWGEFLMDWLKLFQSESRKDRKFGIEEAQVHKAWRDAVESLAEISLVGRRVSVETAMAKLTRIVSHISTQPRAVHLPVQIGEMITMGSQSFTHLWVMGMNNETLPGRPNPSPFIPLELQIDRGMPNSSTEDLTKRLDQRFSRLVTGADCVILSYAQSDGSEVFNASSLIRDCKPFARASRFKYPDYKRLLCAQRDTCEIYADWIAPSLANQELASFKGGSAALQYQSKCYFRAFAMKRLNAEPIRSLEIGIDALFHGSLAHDALEELYADIESPSAIQLYSESLQQQIEQVVRHVVHVRNKKRIRPIRQELIAAEIEQLIDVISEWMNCDARGPENRTVFELELSQSMQIAGLPVRLRIDRVDLQARPDGSHEFFVIDYKTSDRYRVSDTEGDRPKELQLLLYACALEQAYAHPVRAIAYGLLKKSKVSLPLREIISYAPNIEPDWKRTVRELVVAFVAGKADVNPLPRACEYCGLESLCRISAEQVQY